MFFCLEFEQSAISESVALSCVCKMQMKNGCNLAVQRKSSSSQYATHAENLIVHEIHKYWRKNVMIKCFGIDNNDIVLFWSYHMWISYITFSQFFPLSYRRLTQLIFHISKPSSNPSCSLRVDPLSRWVDTKAKMMTMTSMTAHEERMITIFLKDEDLLILLYSKLLLVTSSWGTFGNTSLNRKRNEQR